MPNRNAIQSNDAAKVRPGFWLVLPSTGERFLIDSTIGKAATALNRTVEQHAMDATDWWVDRCLGADVDGKPAWVNLDQTDRLLAYSEPPFV